MYKDRLEAGEKLAELLSDYHQQDVVLLAVPRGGVIVAKPVAEKLHKTLHVLITRKIGHPQNPEVAIGAVMPDGSVILDEFMRKHTDISDTYIEQVVQDETSEIQRRTKLYTMGGALPALTNITAIIIDDGIATGYTIKAAIRWLKTQRTARIVVAVPVAPPEVIAELGAMVDEVVCPLQPEPFWAVGQFYQQFPQNTDDEVIRIVAESNKVFGCEHCQK